MTKTKTVLELNNLSKSYGNFKALNGINLNVKKGEIIGFLGPNGAGKTTTLKLITGLLKADQGEIRILDQKINKKIPIEIREKMGVVFEESNLYSRLSALDNLNFFAGINNVNKNRVTELLEEYQLSDSARKEVRTFSKGMKKRLMICRSLLAKPDILILDEATGGLDPISAEIIRKKVLALKKEGKTVILSTHYLEEADRLCDRVVFINRGKIIAVDKPSVFKESLNENYLEVKFQFEKKSSEEEIKFKLEQFLDPQDQIKFKDNFIIINFLINQKLFERTEAAAKIFKIIELSKKEANLQQVFNKLNR